MSGKTVKIDSNKKTLIFVGGSRMTFGPHIFID
jgi:hypothetical protein